MDSIGVEFIMSRSQLLESLTTTPTWDIIIVGGGATGLGIAVDAASRGHKTLLLEAHDYAKGTSSRSTKLVHGGVRYLAQGNISLVYEALHERGRLRDNAPHLVRVMPNVVPAYSWFDMPFYGAGLLLYSLLAGRLGFGFSQIISAARALTLAPTLTDTGLKGGIIYYDGQFDDARLAITLLRTASNHGATLINHMPVHQFTHDTTGRINGVVATDSESGISFTLNAKAVINATGIFVDKLRTLDDPAARTMVAPSQGIHIVVDRSFLPGNHAVMIPKTADGRVLFAVPWHDCVVIGTTDTPMQTVELEPRALESEIEFVLSHTEKYLRRRPQANEILSVFAGQRPLVKASGDGAHTKSLSRDHTIVFSASGLMTITGGKWTTYRHMGEDAVNRIEAATGLTPRPSVTKNLRLHGYSTHKTHDHLQVYGSDAQGIHALINQHAALGERLHPELPYLAAEVVWAVRMEQARTVEDVLSRRLRALITNATASIACAPKVAHLIATELGYDETWVVTQVSQYTTLANGYRIG